MKAPLTLLALGAALLSPLSPLAPSYAAGETCRGVPATVVGTPGAKVTGTEGPDVIVSGGAVEVRALGGDDLVCTTASAPPVPASLGPGVTVFGGAGDDVVDRSGDTGPDASGNVYPEAGRDTVVGSPSADFVLSQDGEVDTVSLGAGDDTWNGQQFEREAAAEPDVVDLGPGDDAAQVGSAYSPDGSLTGGDGVDSLYFMLPRRGSFTVDAGAGVLRRGDDVQQRFSGFDAYSASGPSDRTTWRFLGSERPEEVSSLGIGLRSADLGGGHDVLVQGAYAVDGKWAADLRGGGGHDTLSLLGTSRTEVDLDLAERRLRVDDERRSASVRGFEDVSAEGSGVSLRGTRRADTLTVRSCRAGEVNGRGGDDVITIQKLTGHRACLESTVRKAYGGAGADVLTGGPERELLDGGRGYDAADGGPGRDTCLSVEQRTSCGRRR